MFLLYGNLWFSVDGPSFLEDRASALPAVPSPSEEVIGTSTDLTAPSCKARALNTLCSSRCPGVSWSHLPSPSVLKTWLRLPCDIFADNSHKRDYTNPVAFHHKYTSVYLSVPSRL